MGGLAFASGPDPIVTPRMKPHVYRAVRDQCQEKLRDLFVVVAAPIEGPAKSSFGDSKLVSNSIIFLLGNRVILT